MSSVYREWIVHVYRSLQERTSRVDFLLRDLTQELGRSPTVAELAAAAGLSQEQVLESSMRAGQRRRGRWGRYASERASIAVTSTVRVSSSIS